jgi:hypothetical protein
LSLFFKASLLCTIFMGPIKALLQEPENGAWAKDNRTDQLWLADRGNPDYPMVHKRGL